MPHGNSLYLLVTNITEFIVDNTSIFDDKSIAEWMNEYFISIGAKLAEEIGAHSNNRYDNLTYANEAEKNDFPSENLFHFSTTSVNSGASRLNKLLPSK